MYDSSFTAIKSWIDSLYRIFQFCSILTVGSLTLGFDKGLLGVGLGPGASSHAASSGAAIPGVFLCLLNLLTAIIGLRTELSNRIYNVASFEVLAELDAEINQNTNGEKILEAGGPFTRPRDAMGSSWVRKTPNVDQLHMA